MLCSPLSLTHLPNLNQLYSLQNQLNVFNWYLPFHTRLANLPADSRFDLRLRLVSLQSTRTRAVLFLFDRIRSAVRVLLSAHTKHKTDHHRVDERFRFNRLSSTEQY